jgi:hypothetical protein
MATSTSTCTRTRRIGRPTGQGRSGGHPARTPALAAVVVALLLSGCGGSDKSWDEGVSSAPMPAPAPAAPMPEVGFDMGRGGMGGDPIAGDRIADERAVIRNASIELVVDDGAAAIDAAEARAIALGGSVASGTRSREEDGTVSGTLMLRVPSDRLEELVDALDALARSVPMRSIDELDVTMQLSDIDAQLANLRAFEAELRALLTEVRERDGTVEGLLAVSQTLRQVRTEIDMIEARRIQLTDQVAMSTVWVYVRQARSTTPVIGTWDLPAVVRDALAATVRLAQLVVEGVVWFVLTVVPALIVLALIVWSVRTLRRRRSRDTADL